MATKVTQTKKGEWVAEAAPPEINRVSKNGKAADPEPDRTKEWKVSMPVFKTIRIGIVGLTPLRMNALPAKGIFEVDADKPTSDRRPWNEFLKAIYYNDTHGFYLKPNGFKDELCSSARFVQGLNGKLVARCIHILDSFVRIHGSMPRMEEVDHRIGKPPGIPIKRYTPQFDQWWAILTVRYISSSIQLNSLISLIAYAGQGGVGDCRPNSKINRTGNSGMFEPPFEGSSMLCVVDHGFKPPTSETTPAAAAAFMREKQKMADEENSRSQPKLPPKTSKESSHGK